MARDIDEYKMAVVSGFFEGQFYDWMATDSRDRQEILAGRMTVKFGKKQMASENAETHDMNAPEKLTGERKSTHGDWMQQSKLAFKLKETMRSGHNYSMLEPHQREALDMIQTKISRILTGDASEPDHWDDISGYAFLGKGGHAKP